MGREPSVSSCYKMQITVFFYELHLCEYSEESTVWSRGAMYLSCCRRWKWNRNRSRYILYKHVYHSHLIHLNGTIVLMQQGISTFAFLITPEFHIFSIKSSNQPINFVTTTWTIPQHPSMLKHAALCNSYPNWWYLYFKLFLLACQGSCFSLTFNNAGDF